MPIMLSSSCAHAADTHPKNPPCPPAGVPDQQQHEELQRAYSQATDLIAQASQAVANLGLSADAGEGFKKALSAFQASEDFLRGWGLSLLGSGKDHAAHSHDKGAAALQRVIEQLQQLLPPGQHSTGCGAASTAGAEIQQSLHCLQHLLTGIEDAAAAGQGRQQAASTSAPGPQQQHQSAGDALKHAWHKLTGKPHELSEAAAQSAQHGLQEAQDAAGTTTHAMHSTAERTADAAKQAAHTASKLPAAAKDAVVEGADQVATTAGFLTEAASLSAHAVKEGLLQAGGLGVGAAKHIAGTASSAEQAAAGAAHNTAQAARHAGKDAAHSVQDTVQSAKDAAAQGLQSAADRTAAGAVDTPAAWTGVHHSLQARLSHVRKTLAAVSKLPSLRPGSLLPGLHHHHSSKSDVRSADSSVTAAHTDADNLQRARAATVQALHEELEALQVSLLPPSQVSCAWRKDSSLLSFRQAGTAPLIAARCQATGQPDRGAVSCLCCWLNVCVHVCVLQAVAEEFFLLATREAHTRRLQQLHASMQHSLRVMKLSEAELAAMYGLDASRPGASRVQVRLCGRQAAAGLQLLAELRMPGQPSLPANGKYKDHRRLTQRSPKLHNWAGVCAVDTDTDLVMHLGLRCVSRLWLLYCAVSGVHEE